MPQAEVLSGTTIWKNWTWILNLLFYACKSKALPLNCSHGKWLPTTDHAMEASFIQACHYLFCSDPFHEQWFWSIKQDYLCATYYWWRSGKGSACVNVIQPVHLFHYAVMWLLIFRMTLEFLEKQSCKNVSQKSHLFTAFIKNLGRYRVEPTQLIHTSRAAYKKNYESHVPR